MPNGIQVCSDSGYHMPLKIYVSSKGVPYAIQLIRRNALDPTSHHTPPLNGDQIDQIRLTAERLGAVDICRKGNIAFATFFRRKAVTRRSYRRTRLVGMSEVNKRRTNLFVEDTDSFLRERLGAKGYLIETPEPPQDKIIAMSHYLMGTFAARTSRINSQDDYGYIKQFLELLLAISPTSEPHVWTILANAYLGMDKLKEAIIASKWAIKLDPTALNNWYILGQALNAYYEGNPQEPRGVLEESLAIFTKLENKSYPLKEQGGPSLEARERLLAKGNGGNTMKAFIRSLGEVMGVTTTEEPEDSKGGNTEPDTSSNTSSAPRGTSSTLVPETGGQIMADVGGFDPSEQDLFSTTSTESATLLYSVTNTTDPNVGIQMVQGSVPTTVGLPTWFTVPVAARPAGAPVH